tara:strand:+ start:687 stop:1193 length:507 start_codon:yes stop_codon:yes gene_type:complete
MARVGLGRLEKLMEELDREIDLEGSDVTVNSLTSDTTVTATAGNVTATAGNIVGTTGTLKLDNGGAVTQGTSKSTTVVLNKPVGKITMHNAALASDAIVTFQVTCATFARATDVCIVNHHSGGTIGKYSVDATGHAAGSFKITVTNISGGSLSEAIVLHYALVQTAHT